MKVGDGPAQTSTFYLAPLDSSACILKSVIMPKILFQSIFNKKESISSSSFWKSDKMLGKPRILSLFPIQLYKSRHVP